MIAPLPEQELQRLSALGRYSAVGPAAEQVFDDITLLAAKIMRTPFAALGFVAADRQWFKSSYGLSIGSLRRSETFCAATIVNLLECTVVGDALDVPSTCGLELVCGPPYVRSYAGAPLLTPDNHAIGTLCVMDVAPRSFSAEDLELLTTLARQAVSQLELRRQTALLTSANDKLQMLATCDSLTGLRNFRALQESIDEEIVFASRNGTPLSLLLLDVDSFKDYNDQYGHPAGDEVLQAISILLVESSRDYDFVARYGGEEFAVVLRNADLPEAANVAERIRTRIAGAKWPLRSVTASIGAVTMAPGSSHREALIAEADRLLYRAKQQGKNRVISGEIDARRQQIVWRGRPDRPSGSLAGDDAVSRI